MAIPVVAAANHSLPPRYCCCYCWCWWIKWRPCALLYSLSSHSYLCSEPTCCPLSGHTILCYPFWSLRDPTRSLGCCDQCCYYCYCFNHWGIPTNCHWSCGGSQYCYFLVVVVIAAITCFATTLLNFEWTSKITHTDFAMCWSVLTS